MEETCITTIDMMHHKPAFLFVGNWVGSVMFILITTIIWLGV